MSVEAGTRALSLLLATRCADPRLRDTSSRKHTGVCVGKGVKAQVPENQVLWFWAALPATDP